MRAKAHWFVRKATLPGGRCSLCGDTILIGESITPWGRRWPHLECAKREDARQCAAN